MIKRFAFKKWASNTYLLKSTTLCRYDEASTVQAGNVKSHARLVRRSIHRSIHWSIRPVIRVHSLVRPLVHSPPQFEAASTRTFQVSVSKVMGVSPPHSHSVLVHSRRHSSRHAAVSKTPLSPWCDVLTAYVEHGDRYAAMAVNRASKVRSNTTRM